MGEGTAKQSTQSPLLPPGVSSEQLHQQMARILTSATFSNAGRMSRFLTFTLAETLAGRGAALKEYTIGVAVFDRPAGFDPRTEPIVRVEARRLRDKLATYYETTGAADDLLIELPKGAYALRFTRRSLVAAPAAPSTHPTPRLAVLPFTTLGGPEAAEDYFVEGLTEELIHLLLQLPGLEVVAWRSSARLRGPEEHERAMRELHLSHFLRGAVRRAGGQVKFTAQLVDAADGRFLWSELFEGAEQDLRSLEVEIARAISQRLSVSFDLAAPPAAVDAEPGSPAHHAFLMGRFHAAKRTLEGLAKSIDCFEQALAERPQYALARAALADSLTLLAGYGDRHPREAVAQAREAAQAAAAQTGCRTASAAGHSTLGLITALHDWNWTEAERLFRRAIAADKNYPTAHHWLAGDVMAPQGRFAEAHEELKIARRLDPLSPVINDSETFLLVLERRYDEALAATRALQDFDPHFYLGHASMGRILTQMGRYDDALAHYEQARRLVDRFTPKVEGAYAQALALAGRRAEAVLLRDRLVKQSRARYIPAVTLAVVELGLGQVDDAVAYAEQGAENRELSAALFGVHPLYDPLRAHPRFRALLARMGLLTVSNTR